MRAVLPLLAAFALLGAGPAAAQFALSQAGSQELQVFADQGIEWHAEDLRVIASGNATAVRGGMTVAAHTLTAYYRQGGKGDEIWRLDADGAVSIRSATETATGIKAVYDLDQAVLVLRGHPARLVTPTDTYQASEAIEYWEARKMAVLRGASPLARAAMPPRSGRRAAT